METLKGVAILIPSLNPDNLFTEYVKSLFEAGFEHILVVDDTFTTGATLSECWITLRRALGPSVRISVATLAMVEA